MNDIGSMVADLKQRTEWQTVPREVSNEDYIAFVVNGIKELYIKTGREDGFWELFVFDEDNIPIEITEILSAGEHEYVMLAAEIKFYEKVQSDVSRFVGYTTDALAVTNADKPYTNIKNTIDRKMEEKANIFSRLINYIM